MPGRPILPELPKLPDDGPGQAHPDRIPVLEGVLEDVLQQTEKMPADLLGVGRLDPDIPPAFGRPAVPHDRPDGNRVAIRPPVRMVGAVGVERVLDGHIPNLAVRRNRSVLMPQPITLAPVRSVEPAGSAAVGAPVGHAQSSCTGGAGPEPGESVGAGAPPCRPVNVSVCLPQIVGAASPMDGPPVRMSCVVLITGT